MATVRHAFESLKDDPADTSVVGESKWNADHELDDVASQADIEAYADFEFIKRRMGLVLTENGALCDGTTDDTDAVLDSMGEVAASSTMHALYVPSLTAISDSIAIPVCQGKTIEGAGGRAGFQMLAAGNGKPIVKFDGTADDNYNGFKVQDLLLGYAVAQTAPASGAIQFYNGAGRAYFYNSEFRNLRLDNAYDAVGVYGAGEYDLFLNTWENIWINDVKGSAYHHMGTGGQNSNQFKRWYINNSTVVNTDDVPAFWFNGQELLFEGLVIQGWNGRIWQHEGSAEAQILRRVHLEACTVTGNDLDLFFQANGPLVVEGMSIDLSWTGAAAYSSVFRLYNTSANDNVSSRFAHIKVNIQHNAHHTYSLVEGDEGTNYYSLEDINTTASDALSVPGQYPGTARFDSVWLGKYKSGVGITNLADGDYTVTPPNGTTGTAHNTTDGKSYSCIRANGTWKSVEVTV